jgi:hypothetical protein
MQQATPHNDKNDQRTPSRSDNETNTNTHLHTTEARAEDRTSMTELHSHAEALRGETTATTSACALTSSAARSTRATW